MAEFEFTVTQRGKKKLKFGNEHYTLHKDFKNGREYWICTDRSCKGRVITSNYDNPELTKSHSCSTTSDTSSSTRTRTVTPTAAYQCDNCHRNFTHETSTVQRINSLWRLKQVVPTLILKKKHKKNTPVDDTTTSDTGLSVLDAISTIFNFESEKPPSFCLLCAELLKLLYDALMEFKAVSKNPDFFKNGKNPKNDSHRNKNSEEDETEDLAQMTWNSQTEGDDQSYPEEETETPNFEFENVTIKTEFVVEADEEELEETEINQQQDNQWNCTDSAKYPEIPEELREMDNSMEIGEQNLPDCLIPTVSMTPKRQSYTLAFKKQALEYAEKYSGEAAAREFKVAPCTIRDWKRKKSEIEKQPRNSLKRLGKRKKSSSHGMENPK